MEVRLAVGARPETGGIWCVQTTAGTVAAPCTNPGLTAFTSIQSAIGAASSGDEIRLSGGTFLGSGTAVGTLPFALTVTGGYPGGNGSNGWTAPADFSGTATVVDGQGARKSFLVQGTSQVTIQNLQVNNGGIQNDSGTVNIGTGPLSSAILNIANGGTTNGVFNSSSGSYVRFPVGTQLLLNNTAFQGLGVGQVNGATVTMGQQNSDTISAENFELDAGTITGPGNFSVTNSLDWRGGIMGSPTSSPGTTTIANSATVTMSTQGVKLLSVRTLNNLGTVNFVDPNGGSLYLGDAATFNNGSAQNSLAAINFQADDSIFYNSGNRPTLHNYGTIRKTVSGPQALSYLGSGGVLMQVLNDGTISAQSGILSMESDSTDTGTFGSLPGARLRFNGGTHALQTSVVSATGDLQVNAGIVISSGSYNVSGTTYVTGGGILELDGTVTMGALVVQDAGVFRGTAVNVITGVVNWTSGTWLGPGVTVISTTAVLNIAGVNSTKVLDGRSINNYGTTNINGTGTGVLVFVNAASFTNEPNASFNILNNDSIVYGSGTAPQFVNLGTINKSGGSGTPANPPYTRLSSGFLTFENRAPGVVNAITGTLSLDGGNTNVQAEGHSGSFNISSGATLRFEATSNATRFLSSSSVTGAGNFEVANGLVTIAAGTYNLIGPGATRILAGTANFDTSAVSRNVSLLGGTLGSDPGAFGLSIAGVFHWDGGFMSGAGSTTTLDSTSTTYVGGVNAPKVLTGRTVNNNGTVVMNETGTGVLYINDGATFNNNADATFDIQNNDSVLYNSGVASTFNNLGIVTKSGGAGTPSNPPYTIFSSGNLAFNSSGTVNVLTGTLSLDGGTTNCNNCGHTGPFNVSPLSALRFGNGTTVFQPGSNISGAGNVSMANGIVNVGGSYNITGSTDVIGGILNFNSTAATAHGSLNSGGTIGGNGTLNITGSFSWLGGFMTGDPVTGQGTTNLAVGATMDLGGVGNPKVLQKRTFNNNGTVNVDETNTGVFLINDGAVFNNNTGAMFDIQNNDSVQYSGGVASQFNNNGTVRKSIGALVSTVGSGNLSFNNSGTVNVMTGTVSFDGGGTDYGNLTISSVANVRFNGGTHNYQAGSSISGAGNVEFSTGTLNMGGTYNLTGLTKVDGGTISFVSNGTSTNTTITAGTLTGPGTFTTNALDWQGGSMDGPGITVLPVGGVGHIDGVGTAKVLSQRTFNNRGTVTMDGTNVGVFQLNNGATFNNQVGATYNIQNNDQVVYAGGNSVVFRNDGTFRRSAGSGTALISTNTSFTFINTGTVDAHAGVLNFTSGYTQNSGSTTLTGGDISTSSNSAITILDGEVRGSGAITGTLENTGGQVSPSSATNTDIFGVIAVYGTYNMGALAAVNVDIAGTSQGVNYDVLHVAQFNGSGGNATLNGYLNIHTANGYVPAVGTGYFIIPYASHTGNFLQLNGAYIGGGLAYVPYAPLNGTSFELVVRAGQPSPTATPSGTRTPIVTFTPTPVRTGSATPPSGSATPSATSCPISFSDVHPSDYFYPAVQYLYCEGAISGYSDGTFRPYANTTRGQLSKIVVNAMGYPINTTGAPHFNDVPVGSTFFTYVETAYNNGLISGYSDGSFRPNNNVTRGQLSKIVVNAKSTWTQVCPPQGHFSDVPSTNPFYCYIETAYAHGIISGYSDGTFLPGNNATRGQISKIVYLAVIQP